MHKIPHEDSLEQALVVGKTVGSIELPVIVAVDAVIDQSGAYKMAIRASSANRLRKER